MAGEKLFSFDPLTHLQSHFVPSADGNSFELHTKQDVEQLLIWNKRISNAREGGWKGDMHHVASLPVVVYHDLRRRGILDDPKAFNKWLNDPDNAAFRTRRGRV